MTNFTDAEGNRMPCTVISAGPCSVIQVKTEETDGYNAVQIGYENKKRKQVGLSTAVSQGADVWVIQALMAVSHGDWFTVVERASL
ncbi:MAG TPA: hypothetical protein DCF84_08050, partial [Bacteroidetes bacterium]|nr:hypothetical protein [Bacteroidota bacterium]